MEERLEKYNQRHYHNQVNSTKTEDDLLYDLTEIMPISPNVDQAWHSLSSKINAEKSAFRVGFYLQVAASVIIALGLGFAYFTYNAAADDNLISLSGPAEVTLSDGSIVTLNNKSTLKYPKVFVDAREVILDGQAFFDVEKGEVPFRIGIDDAKVTVLGTKFMISQGRINLRVQVVEGTVSLVNEDDQLIITSGQEGLRHNKSQNLTLNESPDVNQLSWKTLQFEFDDTPLSSVVRHLNRHFGSNIELADKTLGKCTISGTFEDQPLLDILDSISEVLNLKVQKKQNRIILKGPGC